MFSSACISAAASGHACRLWMGMHICNEIDESYASEQWWGHTRFRNAEFQRRTLALAESSQLPKVCAMHLPQSLPQSAAAYKASGGLGMLNMLASHVAPAALSTTALQNITVG